MIDDEVDNDDFASYFDLLEQSTDWLSYESWRLDEAKQGQPPTVRFTYNFCGAKKISCTLQLPAETANSLKESPSPMIQSALFHVGLVILAWVWMSLPTTDIRIAADYLSPEQVCTVTLNELKMISVAFMLPFILSKCISIVTAIHAGRILGVVLPPHIR
jgi:hypothetical protein